MPPELKIASAPVQDWVQMLINLCAAFVAGLIVAAIYKGTRQRSHVMPSFPPTLVLLAILLAMVTQVIGESLARAFGLVGALSIVRFRTVVRDTQDTAFVIFAVVVGMACGAQAFTITALGLAVGGIAAALVRTKTDVGWEDSENTLNLRLGLGVDHAVLLKDAFDTNVEAFELLSVVTAKGGAAIEYVYRVRMKPEFQAGPFVRQLTKLDGVQNVELRRGEPELG